MRTNRAFTLIEIIIVIIIVGILAAVGLTQYSTIVEKARTAEAKVRIGIMRQLAYEYYLNNGTLIGIANSDVGVDNVCSSTDFYRYSAQYFASTESNVSLSAIRCSSGGKTPNVDVSARYVFSLNYNAQEGTSCWRCNIIGGGDCGLGYPVGCTP